MKKARKYQSGGVLADKNPNIQDDVRQRALMYAGLGAQDRNIVAEGFANDIKRQQQAEAEGRDAALRAQPEMDKIIRAALAREKTRTREQPSARMQEVIRVAKLREANPNVETEYTAPDKLRWPAFLPSSDYGHKKGGAIKMASGGSVSSASKRADGIAQRGKTRGKVC